MSNAKLPIYGLLICSGDGDRTRSASCDSTRKAVGIFHDRVEQLRGLVALVAGALAGSISLVGFGIDSFIEVTSGGVLLWRMSIDADVQKRERREKLSLRIVGVCFLALAAYVLNEPTTLA